MTLTYYRPSDKWNHAVCTLAFGFSGSVWFWFHPLCCMYQLFFLFVCLFCFLGPYPWHMEVPRLGIQSELQLLAYTTATATRDPSRICDLHHSSQPHQIPDPLSEARDRTRILMDTSRCVTMGAPRLFILSSIPLYEYTSVCLSSHFWMNIWVVASLGL